MQNEILEIVSTLERDEGLELGGSPWEPDVRHDSVFTHQVDWRKLFPEERPQDQGLEYDWEVYGDDWEVDTEDLGEIFEPVPEVGNNSSPEEWDVCAWYQPIHFHGIDWGIFIKEDCLKRLARKIFWESGISSASLNSTQKVLLYKGLIRTSFSVFYHHELYHHKTECLGLRIHAVQRRSSYLRYFSNVYKVVSGTDDQIEEALANAYMYRDVGKSRWVPNSLAYAARSYLMKTFPRNPPGYRLAGIFLADSAFYAGQYELFSRVLEGSLTPHHNPIYWRMAPRINQTIFDIKSDIWTVVPRGVTPIIPTTSTPFKTCSSNQIMKVCANHGYSLVPKGGKGSHIKLEKKNSPMIIIPANRDNVSPTVAKTILSSLGYKMRDLPGLL